MQHDPMDSLNAAVSQWTTDSLKSDYVVYQIMLIMHYQNPALDWLVDAYNRWAQKTEKKAKLTEEDVMSWLISPAGYPLITKDLQLWFQSMRTSLGILHESYDKQEPMLVRIRYALDPTWEWVFVIKYMSLSMLDLQQFIRLSLGSSIQITPKSTILLTNHGTSMPLWKTLSEIPKTAWNGFEMNMVEMDSSTPTIGCTCVIL